MQAMNSNTGGAVVQKQKSRSHFDKLIKLVLIGDSSVGKTCLLMRFSENRFPEEHMPTIGIDFKIKMV